MVQKKLVKKQKLKIVDRDDVPNTYFDDWEIFLHHGRSKNIVLMVLERLSL
jgi:hypothetical protein